MHEFSAAAGRARTAPGAFSTGNAPSATACNARFCRSIGPSSRRLMLRWNFLIFERMDFPIAAAAHSIHVQPCRCHSGPRVTRALRKPHHPLLNLELAALQRLPPPPRPPSQPRNHPENLTEQPLDGTAPRGVERRPPVRHFAFLDLFL